MKKNNTILALIISIVIVSMIIIIIVIIKLGNNEEINGIEEYATSEGNTAIKEVEQETSKTMLYITLNCLREELNSDSIYIKDMYRTNDENEKVYFVHTSQNEKSKYYAVYLDYNTYAYKLEEINVGDFNNVKEGRVEKKYLALTSITATDDNTFSITSIDDSRIAELYYDIVKSMIISEPNELYNSLNDEYKAKRFSNQYTFTTYCNDIKGKLQNSSIIRYNRIIENNIEQYVCVDSIGNTFAIKINSTFDIEVKLDDYTIETTSFKQTYESATDEKKVLTNVDKFVKMLNSKDYEAMYNLLDNTYKENNFSTLQSYRTYLANNFFDTNFATTNSISLQGQYYVVNLTLRSSSASSANAITKNIVISLQEGTDFKMSIILQ